jgi:prevent-host-death family protein
VKSVGAHGASVHFSQLLREVEDGAAPVGTRRGTPVARLSPIDERSDDVAAAIEGLHHVRCERRPTPGGIPLRQLIEAGRR